MKRSNPRASAGGGEIRAEGAESCYIDYHPSFGGSPFGKVICTSVNDAALHGLPHDYRLRDGDVLSLDGGKGEVILGAELVHEHAVAQREPARQRHQPQAVCVHTEQAHGGVRRPAQRLILIFQVSLGRQIKSFNKGQKEITKFEPPINCDQQQKNG